MLDGFHIRGASFQPVRNGYARQVLVDRQGYDPAATKVLVIGPGGDLLAGQLARMGFDVTGPSGLDPRHLPFGDMAFDVAYYADTFEITHDLDGVVGEAARVVRDGGTVLYDTVNRTPLSRLLYLGVMQSWPGTRIFPRGRYAKDRLRPPAEVAATLGRYGLRNDDARGFLPGSPLRLFKAMRRARKGTIGDDELAELSGMHLGPDGKAGPVTYLGFATKTTVP